MKVNNVYDTLVLLYVYHQPVPLYENSPCYFENGDKNTDL